MRVVNIKKVFYSGLCALFVMAAGLTACTEKEDDIAVTKSETDNQAAPLQKVHKEVGEASWYGPGFHGKKTASGEIFDQKEMTAAHPTLPLGTEAKVTNLENKKKVEVEITDRGPYVKDRVIDLSKGAAQKLGMKEEGVSKIKVEAVEPVKKRSSGQAPSQTRKKQAAKTQAKSAAK
jgi:rare lipoprotein A